MTQTTEQLLIRLTTLTEKCHSIRRRIEEGGFEFHEASNPHVPDRDRLLHELDVPVVETALLYAIEVVVESIAYSKQLAQEMGCDAIVNLLEDAD
jgi:hypothetical protein